MLRKVLYGIVWFVVLFLICYIVGGYIYFFTTGIKADQSIEQATLAYRDGYLDYMLLGSFILVVAGSAFGVLPGTRTRRK